ncbi:MAG: hypothetical protein DRN81_03785 [Thermoproteota archaeon]|nr:MAG: hypothetical protein DRN81_03785 [Candidatus Korarchaeota archaeon]
MLALKCDKCGKLFDFDDADDPVSRAVVSIVFENGVGNHLCPECVQLRVALVRSVDERVLCLDDAFELCKTVVWRWLKWR